MKGKCKMKERKSKEAKLTLIQLTASGLGETIPSTFAPSFSSHPERTGRVGGGKECSVLSSFPVGGGRWGSVAYVLSHALSLAFDTCQRGKRETQVVGRVSLLWGLWVVRCSKQYDRRNQRERVLYTLVTICLHVILRVDHSHTHTHAHVLQRS